MSHQICKFLDKVGGTITYFRNFVLNTIFLVIFFFVAMFIAVGCIAGSVQDLKETKEKDVRNEATVLTINFGAQLTDNEPVITPLEKLVNELNDENEGTSSMINIKQGLDSIAKDPQNKIKAIFLDMSSLPYARLDQTKTLGASIDKLKKKGIKVYAYSPAFSQSEYALAAHADVIGIDPLGEVEISGIAMKTLYYKNLLDNVSLDVFTPKAGTHKSAVEPYNRNDMSPQVKKEYQGIISELWEQYKNEILSARSAITPEDFNTVFAGSDAYLPAVKEHKGSLKDLAITHHFADMAVSYKDFLKHIAKEMDTNIVFKKSQNNFKIKNSITLEQYLADHGFNPQAAPTNSKAIAVVYGLGEITSTSDSFDAFTAESIIPQLRRIGRNPKIGAVIMYMDTPGGEVYASEQIRRELLDLKSKGKKIIVYMSGMTASGGYWISTAADLIVADPSTITGSIGVLAITGSASRLAQNIGINADGVENSDMALSSVFLPINDKQKEVMQLWIDNTYHTFVENVSKARDIPYDETDKIAQGRIYTGKHALEIKLVDKLGSIDTAISAAGELMKVPAGTTPEIVYSQPIMNNTMELLNSFMVKAVSKVSEPMAMGILQNLVKDPVLKGAVKNAKMDQHHAPLVYSYTPVSIDY